MRVKVVDLNVWVGGKLFDNVLNFLRKENADILTLQEVYNGSDQSLPRRERILQIISGELGYDHVFFSPCYLDEKTEGKLDCGDGILSRFPIGKTSSVFYDIPYGIYSDINPDQYPFIPRVLQHAEILLGEKIIDLFNTQGIFGFNGKDSQRRLSMSEKIIEAIRGKENVVLAGDFNVDQNTTTIHNIEKYLKNVFKDELTTSFNMGRKTNPGYATAVVDMIFVSKNIGVVDRSCPQVDISDHLPLVCTLRLD